MSEWTNRDDRQADAKAQYEHIMTTPAPPAIGAYIEAGVIGFVFGEMWRRGVLTRATGAGSPWRAWARPTHRSPWRPTPTPR